LAAPDSLSGCPTRGLRVPTIAILDDRKDDRETIRRVVISTLKRIDRTASWNVVADDPPSKERDVLHWLDENDAPVLVTDWKLNEGAKGERVVNYEADRLIQEIRARRPSFPIFVITGFPTEAGAYLKDVENIFTREQFAKNAATIVSQVIRAGLRRYDEQRNLLAQMDDLSRRVATGRATEKDRADLKGLHGYFQADLPCIISLDTVLSEFEAAQKRADALRRKVERRLKPTTRRK